MMEKLQEMQKAVEQSKQKLNGIRVTGTAEYVSVEMNGNRRVLNVAIQSNDQLDKEELEDLLTIAFNRALDQADKVNEMEMANGAKGIIPGL